MDDHEVLTGITVADDGTARCWWAGSDPLYLDYHDREWGFPVRDDRRLFEKLCLEGFQSGLSWLTVLRKREAFRRAFAGFDFDAVAQFGPADRAAEAVDLGRAEGNERLPRVACARQGSEAARLALRRADDGVLVHARC